METPILTTKLYTPTPQATAIRRPVLLARLAQGLSGKLTLLTAPAGFGKSTLVSQWVGEVGRPVAWLTLDEHDNDTTRLLAYIIAALQQRHPPCGAQTLALLRSPQPPPLETLLTTLLNELALVPQPLVLVLDDYHLLTADAIHQMVNFLLAYLPPQVHLVLISRREPPLALARLRVRGELAELTAADLRFSITEATEFFATSVGMPLAPDLVATLDARTEGWPAGLRLAAVALQGVHVAAHTAYMAALLANFRGDDRHVFAYLTEEVFDRQSQARQAFLVQTALLPQLCGPLCDAVTGNDDSQSQLEELARENLFLLPLDNQRQWYRYHPLFADFLHHRLQQWAPAVVAACHQRAAGWYAAHGLVAAAIDHAFAAHDDDQAVALIEANVLRLALSTESTALDKWLHKLPPLLSETRPLLAFAQAGLALLKAQFVQAKQWVEIGEHALHAWTPPPVLPVAPATLQGYLDALHCTAMVNLHEPVNAIIAVARRALEQLPAAETFLRGAVALNLGDAYARCQENTLASAAFAEAIALTQDASNLMVHLAALGSQGESYAWQGQLAQAAAIYQRAIAVGQAWGQATGQTHPATGKAHAFYAAILYAWNQLPEAEHHALAAVACCKRWGHTQHLVDSYVALITSLAGQGKWEQANAALTAARLVATTSWQSVQEQRMPSRAVEELVATVDHAQLLLWLRQGYLADVARWLADHAEEKHLALCFARVRLALAQHEPATAARWLAEIAQQLAQRPYYTGQIRWQLLQAQLDPEQALTPLRTALTLAEPGGYVRIFLDEGPAVMALLQRLLEHEPTNAYAQRLLAAFPSPESPPLASTAPTNLKPLLVEPLSEREREVLRLMAADLTYAAIGETLVISLNTVRTHTKNIYNKLNVNRRAQAIARAQALGLL